MAHATDPTGSKNAADWWRKQYGRKPDPALNLPNKFIWRERGADGQMYEHWLLKNVDDDSRKYMSGFYITKNERDPITGNYEHVDESLQDGEPVRLCARVYNYSLSKPTGRFQVKFYYIPWNHEEARAVGDPQSQPAMTTYVSNLIGIQTQSDTETSRVEVCVPFDTTGLSHTSDPAVGYRFLVNLDEPDAVDEIHELNDEEGNELAHCNNSGMWPWDEAVMVHSISAKDRDDDYYPDDTDVWMEPGSLAVETDDGLIEEDGAELVAGRTYRLRVRVHAADLHNDHHHVLFYEDEPEVEDMVISVRRTMGLRQGHNYIWASWKPLEPGEYLLHARMLEDYEESSPEDAHDTLVVNVLPAQEEEDDADGGDASEIECRCELGTLSASESGVSAVLIIVATVFFRRRAISRKRRERC